MGSTSPLVQYIVVRTDLISRLGWTVGAVIAQACHATTAAALQYREDEHARQYFDDVNNMHKIVLGISSETKLLNLSKKLTDFYVDHRVWTEQPEDIPTCLVTKPAPKKDKAEFFKKLQLFRSPGDKSKKNNKDNKSENDDSKSEARGDEVGDRQVQLSRGAGDMPKIMDNDANTEDHTPKKRNSSGRSHKEGNHDGHGQKQRGGSGDSRRSSKKKNRDSHDDDDDNDNERSGNGENDRERSGHEGKKDKNHTREDRKDRRKERERNDKNDLDDAFERMSDSPKLPPIDRRAI